MTNQEDLKNKLDFDKLTPVLNIDKVAQLNLTAQIPAKMVVIFSRHKYYRHLVVELASVVVAKNAKLKNPIQIIDPLDLVWKTEKQAELKFYTGISRFKNNYNEGKNSSDLEALKAIAANPLNLDFYLHDEKINAVVNASSVVKIKLVVLKVDL